MVTVCLTCTANSVVSREREESSPSSLYTHSCFPYCSLIAINFSNVMKWKGLGIFSVVNSQCVSSPLGVNLEQFHADS